MADFWFSSSFWLRGPFWLRSGRSRPLSAISVLVLTTLTVAAAAAGPLISRAIDESALAQAIASAPADTTDIVVSAQFGQEPTVADAADSVQSIALDTGSSGLFAKPVQTAASDAVDWRSRTRPKVLGRVIATSDDCARIPLVSGRCASTGTDVVVARGRGPTPALGSSITVGYQSTTVVFTVVGIADLARATLVLPAATATLSGDDLLVSLGGLQHAGLSGQVTARAALVSKALTLDRLPDVPKVVALIQADGLHQDEPLSVQTGLTALLDQAEQDRRAADVLLLLVTVQALAAAWLGAFVVFGVVAQERQREWALGRLRGLRRRRWLSLVFGEMVVLLIGGSVLGLGLALVAGRLAIEHWLRPGTALQPGRIPVLSAALLALLGSVAALAVSSLRAVRAPLATLLREAGEPIRVTRLAAVSETVVLVAAVAAVIQLRTSSDLLAPSARLALVTPAVLAAALGLLIIRGLVGFGRRLARRPARSLFAVVVLRRLVRTPTQLRSALVVAMAVSVLVFSSQLSALSGRNRTLLANATTGADTVLTMQVPPGVDYLAAVRQADPSGRAAMAVEVRNGVLDNGTSRVVAVDTERLAAVTSWRPLGTSLSLKDIARRLHPSAAPAVQLRGTRVTVQLDGAVVLPQGGNGRKTPIPQLIMTVGDSASWSEIPLGTVRPGAGALTAAIPCASGCRLVRFALDNRADDKHTAYTATFSITGLSTDQQPAATFAAALQRSAQWRADPVADGNATTELAKPTAGLAGLAVRVIDLAGTATPSFSPADVPNPLPGLVASNTEVELLPGESGSLEGVGLNGEPQLLALVGPQLVLPRLLGDGVLVDLADAKALSDPAADEATVQLWLTPGAHPDVLAALARQHITVLGQEHLTNTKHSLAQAAAARAASTSALLSLLVTLLAAAVLLGAQLLARERRRELLDVLELSRIGRTRTLGLVTLESALPALAGALIGLVAGLVALLLSGTRLPLFAEEIVHQPLQVAPAWGALGLLMLATALVVGALSAALALVESRQR